MPHKPQLRTHQPQSVYGHSSLTVIDVPRKPETVARSGDDQCAVERRVSAKAKDVGQAPIDLEVTIARPGRGSIARMCVKPNRHGAHRLDLGEGRHESFRRYYQLIGLPEGVSIVRDFPDPYPKQAKVTALRPYDPSTQHGSRL